MDERKSYIPVKLFLGYAIFAALFAGVTIMLFSENADFSNTEKKIADENTKILKINAFLSKVYESESLSRITIQSTSSTDYSKFTERAASLAIEIDSLKSVVQSKYQIRLLDSVKLLLSRKKSNIDQLREIKNRAGNEARVTSAINELARMEHSLRKLELEDFVKNPSELGNYQRSVLNKYVDYLNQNIPDDETNTLSQKVLDSMLVASRTLLNEVKQETIRKNRLLNNEEKKLFANELLISSQLQKILSEIEREIIANTAKNNHEKDAALSRIIRIITTAAIIGLVLAFFFSLLIFNDFLKTKKYKKRLEIANERAEALLKSREQLIATVSHDLKTPLSTISGYTELLSHAGLSAKQNYYNGNIKGASEYISRLVQDLLDFTQIEAGKIVIEDIPFSLPEIIADVAKSIQSVHREKSIDLRITSNPSLETRVIGDPFRIRQILTNLIGNAYKFTSEGIIGIMATADAENDRIIIRVSDSGIGIAADKLQLIFEEFTQADETVEKRFGGTGLGLTISRKMAEILGGTLTVESEEGTGSTFTLSLKLRIDSFVLHKANPAEKMKIGVVDDDVNLLRLTSEILKHQNHTIFTYTTAAIALADLEDKSCDLILTDLQMPEMDGFEFLSALQKTKWFNQPIIAVTGKANVDEKRYKSLGFAAVIRKPYTHKQLNAVIDAVMHNMEVDVVDEELELGSPVERLRKFFHDDENTLQMIIASFINDASANLDFLEKAVEVEDVSQVKQIAHKMGPMFRQLGIKNCSELLFELEIKTLSATEIRSLFRRLKPEATKLFDEIRQGLVI